MKELCLQPKYPPGSCQNWKGEKVVWPGRVKEGQVTVLYFYQEYCSGGHEAEDENRSIFYEREDDGS